ncbi:hypothetical protein JW899_01690 [Candidatus Uhrbacteria bacterium]|nr:hypothetical protein [Candidatus Uhrbacteria bacterium]
MPEDKGKKIAVPKGERIRRVLAAWLPAIAAFLVVAYVAGAWFLVFSPKIAPLMPGGSYDFTALKGRIAEDQAYIERVEAGLKAYQAVPEEYRDRVRHMVPEGLDFPELVVQLEEIAERNAVSMEVVDMSVGEPAADGLQALRVTVSFSGGNYLDFKNLMGDLQNLERLLDIVQTGHSPDNGRYQFTMKAYRMVSGKTVGGTVK